MLARELTKVHEEFIRGTVKEIYEIADDLKGEMVIVMEGNKDDYPKDVDYGTLITMVSEKVAAGISRSDAIKDVASVTGISRRRLYELVHSKDN